MSKKMNKENIETAESPIASETPLTEPAQLSVTELQQLLAHAKQKELDQVTELLTNIESDHQVGIGVQLDIQKLTDIITFMISNNKSTITLKFEVWK
jgi:hypothetical protein